MKRFRKIFSCALVVISFILLFTSWALLTPKAQSATVKYYNEAFKPDTEVKTFSGVMSKMKTLDLDEYLGVNSILGDNVTMVNSVYDDSGLRSLFGALSDGGMDVTQTALAARTVNKIYGYAHGVSSFLGVGEELRYTVNTGVLSAYNAVIIILFILSILCAIATFIVRMVDRLKEYRKYDLAFFIIQLLLFVLVVIFVGCINSTVNAGFPILGISVWGILSVIFACPSILLDKIPLERLSAYTGRSIAMNDTAYAFSGTVSKTMDKISNKMDETAQGVRLTRELKNRQEELEESFATLGKEYYKGSAENPPEEMRELFQAIREQQDQINSLRKDIDVVNNVVACPACGHRWNAGTKFCAECGGRLPSITEDREEFDYEMKQKKEKKAGKSFCKYCGAKVEDDDDFCPGCGRSL